MMRDIIRAAQRRPRGLYGRRSGRFSGPPTASASTERTWDDVPHRRRDASYPETPRNDPKHDVFLIQDTWAVLALR